MLLQLARETVMRKKMQLSLTFLYISTPTAHYKVIDKLPSLKDLPMKFKGAYPTIEFLVCHSYILLHFFLFLFSSILLSLPFSQEVKVIPETAQYRVSVEMLTNERLSVVSKDISPEQVRTNERKRDDEQY